MEEEILHENFELNFVSDELPQALTILVIHEGMNNDNKS